MAPIRVLVVDDSLVIRRVLCDALASDPEIEICGTAPDGGIALSKIPLLKPDVITLDVEMPNVSGIETLKEIRKVNPKLPVIMFSTLTERGAGITLDALSLGASDYATKPHGTGSLEETRSRIQQELIPKVKALCHRAKLIPPKWAPRPTTRAEAHAIPRASSLGGQIDVLVIGTSTGGPNALAVVLPRIRKDFPVPIVIVQHMPPVFTRLLAERLQKQSAIRIQEGQAGAVLKPGEAWIAPGDFHMTVEREERVVKLAMNQQPPENSCRPAVDVLFRSVARVYGANALGVVLTGMGSDGLLGAKQMKSKGAHVLVQDEASSVVWGMPGQVAAAGLADGIYPLEEISTEVERRVGISHLMEETRNSQRVAPMVPGADPRRTSTVTLSTGKDRQ